MGMKRSGASMSNEVMNLMNDMDLTGCHLDFILIYSHRFTNEVYIQGNILKILTFFMVVGFLGFSKRESGDHYL